MVPYYNYRLQAYSNFVFTLAFDYDITYSIPKV